MDPSPGKEVRDNEGYGESLGKGDMFPIVLHQTSEMGNVFHLIKQNSWDTLDVALFGNISNL